MAQPPSASSTTTWHSRPPYAKVMNPGHKPGAIRTSFETHEWNAITSARPVRRAAGCALGIVDWSIDGRGSSRRPVYTVADGNESVTGSVNEDEWQHADDDRRDRFPVGHPAMTHCETSS